MKAFTEQFVPAGATVRWNGGAAFCSDRRRRAAQQYELCRGSRARQLLRPVNASMTGCTRGVVMMRRRFVTA
jgi:hypothetical protein